MAKTIEKKVTVVSDLSGDPADQESTIKFTYAGVSYSIDATAAELAEFEQVLAPYRAVAKATERKLKGTDSDASKIRTWAATKGHTVSPRGRIPQGIRDEYDAAHPAAQPQEEAAPAPQTVAEPQFANAGVSV